MALQSEQIVSALKLPIVDIAAWRYDIHQHPELRECSMQVHR